jgi:hypothetical protein
VSREWSGDAHPVQHGVGAERKRIPALDRPASVAFHHGAIVGVGHVIGRRGADRLPLAPALRVIGVSRDRRGRRRAGPGAQDRGQAAFGVIAIGEAAVIGQIAFADIGRGHGADGDRRGAVRSKFVIDIFFSKTENSAIFLEWITRAIFG